eukprot:109212-Amphidinium_carterae.1
MKCGYYAATTPRLIYESKIFFMRNTFPQIDIPEKKHWKRFCIRSGCCSQSGTLGSTKDLPVPALL